MEEKERYSISLTKETALLFNRYLKEREIEFEASEEYNLIHFSCHMTLSEVNAANDWIYQNLK